MGVTSPLFSFFEKQAPSLGNGPLPLQGTQEGQKPVRGCGVTNGYIPAKPRCYDWNTISGKLRVVPNIWVGHIVTTGGLTAVTTPIPMPPRLFVLVPAYLGASITGEGAGFEWARHSAAWCSGKEPPSLLKLAHEYLPSFIANVLPQIQNTKPPH